jgi:uncharacterized protein
MEPIQIHEVIPGSKNKPITLDVTFTPNGFQKPVVIFVHGFKGFKDWGHFNKVANSFAREGFTFLKFNFSHNGTSPESLSEFIDLEAFGQNNYIIELDDLKKVIDWVVQFSKLKKEIDSSKIYLIGHSRGGGICILKSNEDKRVKKLVTWASVSDFINRNKKRTIETWKKDGVVYASNTRTGQEMPMYLQFYEIMMSNKERLNILRAAGNLAIQYLIIHGTSDEAVPFQEAENLHKSAKFSKLFTVPGANHTFGISHPYSGVCTDDANKVMEQSIVFLKDQ